MRILKWRNAMQSPVAITGASVIYLSVGATAAATADIFDLHDLKNTMVLIGQCDWGDPDQGDAASGAAGSAGTPPGQQEGFRIVKLRLRITGGDMLTGVSMDAQQGNAELLAEKLVQAEDAWNSTQKGNIVTLTVGLTGTTRLGYLDVMKGRLVETPTAFGSSFHREYTLELTCSKYWRTDPIVDPPVTITNNGQNAFIYRAAVPGDAPALNHSEVTDLSGNANTATLIAVHGSRKSAIRQAGGSSADFTPIVLASLYGGPNGVPGTVLVDATAMGGRCVRATPGQAGAFFAQLQSMGGILDHGRYDVYLHLRDGTLRLVAPTVPTPTVASAGGTGSFVQFAICGKDASGLLGPPTYTAVLPCTTSTTFTISPTVPAGTATPVAWRCFTSLNFGAWQYPTDFSVGPFTAATSVSGGTFAVPPTGSTQAISTTGITPYYGILPDPSIQSTFVTLGQATQTVFPQTANGQWEYLYIGSLTLPPQARMLRGQDLQWLLLLYAQRFDAQVANLDVGGMLLCPSDGLDQAQWIASYTTTAQAQALKFIAETRSDGRYAAYARDPASGGLATLLAGTGENTLGPGDNWLMYRTKSLTASGQVIHNVASSYQIQNTITPRSRGLPGLVGGVYA